MKTMLFPRPWQIPNIDSVNATSLTWAAAILLLGPAVGLAAKQ